MSPIRILHLEDSVLDADLVRFRLAKEGLDARIDQVMGRVDYLSALRESERLHRMTLDSVRDYAILTMDTEGRIIQTNAGVELVLGYRENELLGQTCERFYTPEDVRDGVAKRELDRAGARGSGDDERWHVRKDGSRFWGSGLVTPLLDESGQLRGFTKVVRDMTERKQAEEALHEADRRKDEFLAMLAHELRNPLSAIHNAALLSRRPELSPEKLEWTKDVIAKQVRHLTHLVDDLLDVSRITRGKIQLRLEALDLGAILKRSLDVARPQFEARGHHLLVSIDPETLPVQGDAVRLEQIFVNLLANAAKYTEPSGQIALFGYIESRELVVRVIDNGIGIDPGMLPRVFDLFAQVDVSLDRTQGGLGIGLTIVKRLVELHGGTIEAESDGPGQGSVFTVRLPLASHQPQDEQETPAETPTVVAGTRILVVDDNMDTAGALAGMLELTGFEVRSIHDGREAVEAVLNYRPSAVLLDIGLPGMDGYEVATQLRRDRDLDQTTIIASARTVAINGGLYLGIMARCGGDPALLQDMGVRLQVLLFRAVPRDQITMIETAVLDGERVAVGVDLTADHDRKCALAKQQWIEMLQNMMPH